jgi:hypothetical protein
MTGFNTKTRAAKFPHMAQKSRVICPVRTPDSTSQKAMAVRRGHPTARNILLSMAACVFCAALLPAQVTVDLKTGIDKATVGDYIPLTLTATVPRGSKIIWPVLEDKLGSLVVLNAQGKDRVAHGDQDYQEYTATIAAYDTGTFQIPALPVTVIPPGESTGTQYDTHPASFIVSSVLPDSGNANIVDIRSQIGVPVTAWEIIWKTAAALGILGLGYALYLAYRWWKRRTGDYVPPPPPPIPPHELAYRQLMELQEEKLVQDGKLTEYFFRLSEIVRRYFEGRYEFPALQMATWDIKQMLPSHISKEELHRRIEVWMDSADMVKFAKGVPGWDECDQALQFAYKIVDETKIIPVPIGAEQSEEVEPV